VNESPATVRPHGPGKVASRRIRGSLTTRLGVANDSFGTCEVSNESFATKKPSQPSVSEVGA